MGRAGNHSQRRLHALALSTHVFWRDREREEQAAAGFESARVGVHVAAGDHVFMDWRLSSAVSEIYREARARYGACDQAGVSGPGPTAVERNIHARHLDDDQRAGSG